MAFLERHLTVEHAERALRSGDLEQAESICRQLLKKNKKDLGALQLRGHIAARRRDFDEALKHYQKCLSVKPREAHFHYLVGKAYAQQGRYSEALRTLDKALALEAGHADAAEWKALVLEWDGRHEEAGAVLEPFVTAGTETTDMAEVQAKVHIRAGRFLDAAAIAGRHLARTDLRPDTRHRLGHVAGDAYEKAGEYDKSFEAHAAANEAVAMPFVPGDYARFIDDLIEVFSRDFLATHSRHGNRSELPVFVAGMPRSGTTLVEQILDAHPLAHGAGELMEVEAIVTGLQLELESSEPFPRCAVDLDAAAIDGLARRYLDRVRRLDRSARRIVNKSLENYRNLGLIAALFPRARIIHCHRDPRDTCVSCYMSGILPGPHPYICDLAHLGFAYRQYERLMAHWKAALPMPVLDVAYETLVDDLDGSSRRLVAFAGLEWDDRCLDFHASGRTVRTASYDQVRRPIYRSSVGRWQRFERHLGPLLEALEADS